MSTTRTKTEPPSSLPDSEQSPTEITAKTVNTQDFIELLADEYAQQIVVALAECPTTAPALAEALDASRPTVYRRLNSLEDVGLVESEVSLDSDGHHRKQFSLTVSKANLTFNKEGVKINSLS